MNPGQHLESARQILVSRYGLSIDNLQGITGYGDRFLASPIARRVQKLLGFHLRTIFGEARSDHLTGQHSSAGSPVKRRRKQVTLVDTILEESEENDFLEIEVELREQYVPCDHRASGPVSGMYGLTPLTRRVPPRMTDLFEARGQKDVHESYIARPVCNIDETTVFPSPAESQSTFSVPLQRQTENQQKAGTCSDSVAPNTSLQQREVEAVQESSKMRKAARSALKAGDEDLFLAIGNEWARRFRGGTS